MSDVPTIETIMTRHVVTVNMDDTVGHVRELFKSVRFHHLVVMEQGRAVGVLSDRDLLKNISPFVGKVTERSQDRFTLDRHVHQIMSRRLVSCGPSATVAEAARLMLDHRVSSLPVLDDKGHCLGIVSLRDVVGWALVQCAGGSNTCSINKAA